MRIIAIIIVLSILLTEGAGLSIHNNLNFDNSIHHFVDNNYCYTVEKTNVEYKIHTFYYTINNRFFSQKDLSIHRIDNSWILNSESTQCSESVEKNFVLEGSKVWLLKIELYEPAELLNSLKLDYILKTTRNVTTHHHSLYSILLLNESKNILFGSIGEEFGIPKSVDHPLFYHSNNHTVDNIKMFFEKDTILLSTWCKFSISQVFDKGIYYIVIGSQAYTLNGSDYDAFYNVSFVFPENYSMSIEAYKQDDPIGVSFSEMNASYIDWDWHGTLFEDGGKTVFIDGDVVLKPKHLLIFSMPRSPDEMLTRGLGWYDFTIASNRYIGFGWHKIAMKIPFYFPLFWVYKDDSLPIKLSYSVASWSYLPIPTSITAFDIDLK